MKKLSSEQRIRQIILCQERERKRCKKNKRRKKTPGTFRNKRGSSYEMTSLSSLGWNSFIDKPKLQPAIGHKYVVKIPKIFSLIENPAETLETLEEVARAARDRRVRELLIDHSDCEVIELGASTVMDVIIMQSQSLKKKNVNLHGIYSKNKKVNEIIRVIGIIKDIKHPHSRLPAATVKKYKIFELKTNHKYLKPDAHQSSRAELVSTDLTTYFDDLLKMRGYSLTDTGKNRISRLISEVIDNAEQHSGKGEWFVIGYMSQISEEIGDCNIAIFNFGDSIYQSLSKVNLNMMTKTRIEALIEKHTRKGFFLSRDKWTAENLWTLFALQEGVSRFNVGDKITDRGHGTVNMIEFFLELGMSSNHEQPPKMALLSEKSYILFDGKYKLKYMDFEGEKRQVIAFNENNSLDEKPDDKYVRNLRHRFPGTIIAMNFYLDNKHLRKLSLEAEENAK